MLAVTASARVSAAPPKEEDTLSRGLGTPPLLETHSPVGYCWQNSRCCRPLRGPQHSHIGDFVSHPNDQAQRTRTAEMSDDTMRGAAAVRGPLQREVNLSVRCEPENFSPWHRSIVPANMRHPLEFK